MLKIDTFRHVFDAKYVLRREVTFHGLDASGCVYLTHVSVKRGYYGKSKRA